MRKATSAKSPPTLVVVSCEHGGNRIPAAYRHLFAGQQQVLASHRGYDHGAVALARELARAFSAPLFIATVSRLVVDLNRSAHHPKVFSQWTRSLPASSRAAIMEAYYFPHRQAVEAAVSAATRRGRVVHLCAHSFTPVLGGVTRQTDIGFLYDPRRPGERLVCRAWRDAMRDSAASLRVRFNYPYRGTADGFTTYLRTRFSSRRYVGIEIELNQSLTRGDAPAFRAARRALIHACAAAIALW